MFYLLIWEGGEYYADCYIYLQKLCAGANFIYEWGTEAQRQHSIALGLCF